MTSARTVGAGPGERASASRRSATARDADRTFIARSYVNDRAVRSAAGRIDEHHLGWSK
jgi:hypothetical protein